MASPMPEAAPEMITTGVCSDIMLSAFLLLCPHTHTRRAAGTTSSRADSTTTISPSNSRGQGCRGLSSTLGTALAHGQRRAEESSPVKTQNQAGYPQSPRRAPDVDVELAVVTDDRGVVAHAPAKYTDLSTPILAIGPS